MLLSLSLFAAGPPPAQCSAALGGRISERDRLLVTLALGYHRPGHARNFVGERDGGDLGWASA
jgi:hypothetical protein